jgi:hypothetical protein
VLLTELVSMTTHLRSADQAPADARAGYGQNTCRASAVKRIRLCMQDFGDMFNALRAVAAYYFRADKQGICNTLEKCACGPETLRTQLSKRVSGELL